MNLSRGAMFAKVVLLAATVTACSGALTDTPTAPVAPTTSRSTAPAWLPQFLGLIASVEPESSAWRKAGLQSQYRSDNQAAIVAAAAFRPGVARTDRPVVMN